MDFNTLVAAASSNGEAQLAALVDFCYNELQSGIPGFPFATKYIEAMANAARNDIGRQEVLGKSRAVLDKDWHVNALKDNFLIEICRFLGNLCYDCPEGRSQVLTYNCLPKLCEAYQIYRQSTSLPSADDKLYLVLPGFLHNFCSDNEGGLALISDLVDLLSADICQMEQDTPIFGNFTNFLTGLSEHESGPSFLTKKSVCDYLVHHVSLSSDGDSIQPIAALVTELGDNEAFCLQLSQSGMWTVLSGFMSSTAADWLEFRHTACDALVMMSSHQSVIDLVFSAPEPQDTVSNWLLGGPANDPHLIQTAALIFGNIAGNDERCVALVTRTNIPARLVVLLTPSTPPSLLHGVVGCLRNLCVCAAARDHLVELFLPEATAELLVGLAAGTNHTVTPKVVATLRLVSQNNKVVSSKMGVNAVLVKSLIDLSENSIIPALAIEGARLLSSLVRYSQSKDVLRTVVEAGGTKLLSSLLKSPHPQLNNETIVALTLATAHKPPSQKLVEDLDVVVVAEDLIKILASEACPAEIKYNALMLLNNIAEWRLEEVINSLKQQKLLDVLDSFIVSSDSPSSPHSMIASNVKQILFS